jgi:hypothetical protein
MSLDVEQTAASIRAGAGVEGNVMEIIPSCLRAAFAAPPPSTVCLRRPLPDRIESVGVADFLLPDAGSVCRGA